MWAEVDLVAANSKIVSEQGKPEIPFFAFISSRNEEDYWQDSINSYAETSGGQAYILDGDHYIHLDYPELIAEKSKEIIEKTIAN